MISDSKMKVCWIKIYVRISSGVFTFQFSHVQRDLDISERHNKNKYCKIFGFKLETSPFYVCV